MSVLLKGFWSEKGQGMVEYALVIAFVVAIAVYFMAGTNPIGTSVNNTFESASTQLAGGKE